MPKAARRKSGPESSKKGDAPYSLSKPAANKNGNLTPPKSNNRSHGPLSERSPNGSSKRKDPPSKPSVPSFLDVRLEGEDDETVPVFDTCAVVRSKIRALLDKKSENAVPGEFDKNGKPKCWIAKRFCEALGVSTASYQNFMKKGENDIPPVEMSGCENKTYYRAYVFFEKKRVFEGEEKSERRLELEKE
jgi:hypothetical protein